MPGAQGDHTKAPDPLGLELYVFVCCHVGVGFLKNSYCFLPAEPSLQSQQIHFENK